MSVINLSTDKQVHKGGSEVGGRAEGRGLCEKIVNKCINSILKLFSNTLFLKRI